MAVNISSTGKNMHHDLNQAKLDGIAYLNGFTNHQRGAFINAIDHAIAAMDVDTNRTHNNSFTIAASLASNSLTITIS